MTCPACAGLMTWRLDVTAEGDWSGWRCLNCGRQAIMPVIDVKKPYKHGPHLGKSKASVLKDRRYWEQRAARLAQRREYKRRTQGIPDSL